MPRASGNAALDRDIRREVGSILWSLAKSGRIRPDVRMTAAQRSAADQAAVDLIEIYEKSADCVLTDLYEEWQQVQNSDRAADHFAYVLVATAFDMEQDDGFDSLLKGGKPTFAIELRGTELVWDGELRDPKPQRRRNPAIPSEASYLGETLGSPVFTTNPRARLAPGVAEHERRARKQGTLECPCGGTMVDTGETRKIPGDVKRYIAQCPKCGDTRYALAPYKKNPACPACGAHIASGASACPSCGIRVRAGTGEIATPLERPRPVATRIGRPPGVGVGNPGAYVRVGRMPTDDELATAWRYIHNEYVMPPKDGVIDGEMWAEGLAFGQYKGEPEDYADVREMKSQLTEVQWQQLTRRADQLRGDQGEPLKYRMEASR